MRLAKVGIPISFQELMVRISFLYLAAVMNRCGVYAAAVVGISSTFYRNFLKNFVMMVCRKNIIS